MSDPTPPTGNPLGPGPRGDDAPLRPDRASVPRRASVRLRAGQAEAEGGLDPANQSLAEALGLVSRVLNFAMIVLAGVFLLSGLTSIRENEVGVRLLFGRVTGENLASGFQFSLPYPMGEMIKVDTGVVTLELDDAFWPMLGADLRGRPIQEIVNVAARPLKPGEDGSLITGDENIAHTRWRIVYQRHKPVDFIRTLLPEDEQSLVRAAVQRGIVHAVAQVRVDDLLKQSGGEQGSVATRARALAQQYLDSIGAGVQVQQLLLQDKAPPLQAYNDFSGVQSAEQKAAQKRAEAESAARGVLNAAAGEASAALIERIEAYAVAIEQDDAARAEAILASIRAIMDGTPPPTEAGGPSPGSTPRVSGRVVTILNDAREYASSVVNRRRAELAAFQSKLAQFRTNPAVVVQREWVEAMRGFLSHPNVEKLAVPTGSAYELWLNRDPEIVRALERARKERDALESDERRKQELESSRFRTNVEQDPMSRRRGN